MPPSGGRPATTHPQGTRPSALRLLTCVLAVTPLVVLPGHVDFSRLPQQAFVQMSALAVLLVWLLERGPSRRGRRVLDAPLIALLGVSALSLAGAADPAGVPLLIHWSCCALVYFVVSRAAVDATEGRRLLVGVFVGGVLVALVGLAQVLGGLQAVPQAAAPASTLANRNVAAGFLVTALPLGLLAWSLGGPRARWPVLAGALAIVAFLPMTLSRLGALALAAQVVLVAVIVARASGLRVRRAAAGLGVAVAVVLVSAVAWLSVHDAAKWRSLEIRADLAGTALEMAREHPWIGVGLGRFGAEYPRFGPAVRSSSTAVPLIVDSPHSEPLHLLAETGLGGGLALVWLTVAALVALARLRRSRSKQTRSVVLPLGLSLLGLAVDAAGGFPLRAAVAPVVAAALLGVLAALEAGERLPSPGRAPTRPARPASWRWAAVGGVALLLMASTGWSARRLSADRSLFLQDLEHQATEAGCPPGLEVVALGEERVDLVVDAAPLADVLRCLSERMGFRLEFDGAAPDDQVTVALQDQPLTTAFDSLFEGLAVDYLLGFDPSGTRVQRLIVVGSSGGTVRPSSPSSATSAPPRAPGAPGSGDPPGGTSTPTRRPGEWRGGPADEGVDAPGYSEERPPRPEPGELSPMTLRTDPLEPYAVRSAAADSVGV